MLAAPATAHHRQTPPIVQLTLGADHSLPRLPAFGGVIGVVKPSGGARQISTFRLYPNRIEELVADEGDNGNPALSLNGAVVVWDSDGNPLDTGFAGRQVFLDLSGVRTQVSHDPTGTSRNPAVSGTGSVIAFESSGDLAGVANDGVPQIYVWRSDTVTQVTGGRGPSVNPSLDKLGKQLVYQSRSHPDTGADTAIDQIWLASFKSGTAIPITDGLGASRSPMISSDGKLVAFESLADLDGTKLDTGVPQVFLYHVKTQTYVRITSEPLGCTQPTVQKFRSDYRIAYMCNGQPYFTLLRADQRRRVTIVPSPSITTRVVAENGPQFLLVSTNARLSPSEPSTGQQIFLLNLYHLEAGEGPATVRIDEVPGTVHWFPSQGIPSLRKH